jgi:hypothetical protein
MNQKYHALDERLNSIKDFLALSEHTLDWQLRVEHQRIENLDEQKFPFKRILTHVYIGNVHFEKAWLLCQG